MFEICLLLVTCKQKTTNIYIWHFLYYHFRNQHTRLPYIYIWALRSRSLRDGSLSSKGRFATFVRSCSALRASKRQLKITSEISMLEYPFGCWNKVNPTIFETCLLYENIDNNYSYQKIINAKWFHGFCLHNFTCGMTQSNRLTFSHLSFECLMARMEWVDQMTFTWLFEKFRRRIQFPIHRQCFHAFCLHNITCCMTQ